MVYFLGKRYEMFWILSKDAYNHFKKYFDALWNQETMAVKGFDNLKFLLRGFIDELKENNEDYLAIGAGFGPKASERKYLDFFKENAAYRNKLGVNSKLLFQQGMEQTVKERKKYLDNPEIKHIYMDYLSAPLSEKSHHLLHTTYQTRPIYKK